MIWQRVFILWIVSLTGYVSGRTSIIKGRDANIADFPHQVSIRYVKEHFCGGAIITEKHILTVAHCFAEQDMKKFKYDLVTIVTGTSFIDGKHGKHHKIVHVTVHPAYSMLDYRTRNDIAVVTLKLPMTFDIYQQKINLPEQDFNPGDKGYVTGWGLITENPETYAKRLQKLETQIISKEECQKKVPNSRRDKIYDTEICTINAKSTGTCTADSGGPLTVNGELVGIIAWSITVNCATKYPDVHTNVFKHKHFIETVIKPKH